MRWRIGLSIGAAVAVVGVLLLSVSISADPIADAQHLRGQDNAQAYAIIEPLAEKGNAEAQAVLAGMYNANEVPGEKPEEAYDMAVFWMTKAAEQGNPDHQNALGSWLFGLLISDPHAHPDPARAIPWFEKAAAQGHSGAMFMLGHAYDLGQGVPQNPAEAARWYQQAIDQGNEGVTDELAALYAAGRGVPQDDTAAAKLYERAARQGSGSAAVTLAGFYETGRGVVRDEVQAYAWYVAAVPMVDTGRQEVRHRRDGLAAKLRLPQISEGQRRALVLSSANYRWPPLAEVQAQAAGSDVGHRVDAGILFLEGELVPQSFQMAFSALQAPADQGDSRALFALGRMYEEGLGMEPDLVEAYVLYRVAGKRSTVDDDKELAASKTLHLESKMSLDLIGYARKRADKWQPKAP